MGQCSREPDQSETAKDDRSRPSAYKTELSPLAPPSLSVPTVMAPEHGRPFRQANFFVRHWRGDYSLAQSFWITGVGVELSVYQLIERFPPVDVTRDMGPHVVGAAMLLTVVWWVALSVWQVVGIWRSSGKHAPKGESTVFFAILARVVAVAALGLLASVVATISPMFPEWAKLAAGIDESSPYEVRLLNNNTELELYGGIPYGAADAVAERLNAFPSVTTIRLESDGGRITEAEKLAEIIRAHHLTTITYETCESACVIAYLAGNTRLLGAGATIGFHSASIGGVDGSTFPGFNDGMRRLLSQRGASPVFIERATSTPRADMWYPSPRELLDSNVVTTTID